MKVAFIGSHGVGKTTLCFELAAKLKKRDVTVELVREVASFCPLPINREASLSSQAWILHTQIAEELAAQGKAEFVVCDRGVVDNYCYLVQTGHDSQLEQLARYWVKTYGAMFKVPIVGALRFDGVRDMDEAFQRAIDETLDRLLEEWGIECHRLDPSRRDMWADDAFRLLEEALPPVQISLFGDGKGESA